MIFKLKGMSKRKVYNCFEDKLILRILFFIKYFNTLLLLYLWEDCVGLDLIWYRTYKISNLDLTFKTKFNRSDQFCSNFKFTERNNACWVNFALILTKKISLSSAALIDLIWSIHKEKMIFKLKGMSKRKVYNCFEDKLILRILFFIKYFNTLLLLYLWEDCVGFDLIWYRTYKNG